MNIQLLQAHWGFRRMPFGRSLAPSMRHRQDGHAEAVARIGWCIDQHALRGITGDVGAGKTVAVRAATTNLDRSRHVVICLPNPPVGMRGMLHHVVSAPRQTPSSMRPHSCRRLPRRSRPSTQRGAGHRP